MSRLERLAPLSAFLITTFAVISFVVVGDTPSGDDSAQKVVEFYTDNETEVWISSILATFAALALVWFAASVRGHIRRAEGEPGRLAALLFGGAILLAAGLTIFAGIEVSAADSVDDVPPEALQAINALDNGMFFTFALGNMVMFISLAVATLRYGVFPRWLGWLLALLAVISLSPIFFIALLLSGVVYPLIGWLIYRAQEAPAPTTG